MGLTEYEPPGGLTDFDAIPGQAAFATPDGRPIDWRYFRVLRGDADAGLIERAVFEVPAGEGYVVSDLTIAGEPIRFGGQIAERITMNLVSLAGPAGAFHSQPVPATAHCCAFDENPPYISVFYRQGCGQGQHEVFQWTAAQQQAAGARQIEPRPFPVAADERS